MQTHDPNTEQTVLTVSQLNALARQLLEECFSTVTIEGEISNLSAPSSGHLYFTLKDDNAQIRCAMFRQYNRLLKTRPEHGMHVRVRARVSLYEGRGDFQLIVHDLEEAGDGALQRAFELLKKSLHAQGLFDEAHKKPLPALPQRIGVITSRTAAALRDILSVLKRRFPSIPVVIYPTQVQGELAAGQIVKAIETANQRAECDVLIVSRGGGSLEDLWPFNEEIVARAIYASTIPIVSGVGHEVDVTISDFVADRRAPTPSAAAELITPNVTDWLHKLQQINLRLSHQMRTQIQRARLQLEHLAKRIRHPGQKLQEQAQRLDQLERRLTQAYRLQLVQKRHRLTMLARALNAISPLNTLSRGYAIATKEGEVLTSQSQVTAGDRIEVRLHEGKLDCTVDSV